MPSAGMCVLALVHVGAGRLWDDLPLEIEYRYAG